VQANLALIRISKTLFSYQIFIVADGTPSVEFLLRDARQRSERVAREIGERDSVSSMKRGKNRGA
jgi:hypothetical protein